MALNAPLVLKVLGPVFFRNDDRFVSWLEDDRALSTSLVFVDFLYMTS